jgi:hypothetical protein
MFTTLSASVFLSAQINFKGSVHYSPTPAPSPLSGINIAPVPSAWEVGQEGSVLDHNVLSPSGNPTIRFGDGYTPRTSARHDLNEINTGWLPSTFDGTILHPGDRIYFKAWIKSEPSSVGKGSIIGFDWYGERSRLWQMQPQIGEEDYDLPRNYVDWIYVPNGADWTLIEMSVTVPYRGFYANDYGVDLEELQISQGVAPEGVYPNPQHVKGFIPFLTPSWGQGETNRVWFGDVEIIINP